MIIRAYYAGGRIDVFDTDRMTDGMPQPGNLLTNYSLDLADVNGESLWLCSYYYEAADAYKNELGPKSLPIARRRDGWSFLIADSADLEKLNMVTADGETALIRLGSDLIDAFSLAWAEQVSEVYMPLLEHAPRLLKATGASTIDSLGIPSMMAQSLASHSSNRTTEPTRF